jgi:DNA mismatch repair protein MutS
MTLVKQYLEYQQDFERKYGEKTIVLMQVGAFFEMYGIENAKQKIGNARMVAEKLNIILTRKNKSKLENNLKNPLMCGFQTPYLKRHLNVLLQDGFTVIIIEQDEVNKQKRTITGIYSPGTYIDDITESDPNNVVSIFIDVEKCYKSGKKLLVLGCSCIDLSTGKNIVNQSHELINDKLTLIEDMNRFIVANNPKEVVLNISSKSGEDIVNNIKMNINLINRKIMSREDMNREYGKVSYQNAFLGKIFDSGALTPIEYLDLEMKPTAMKSYMHLLQFCYEHNPNFLKKIDKPIIWNHNEHLVLYNDSIYQLDVVPNNNHLSSGCKIKSLFHVLNKTRTAMGRRLLKYRLINPITSCSKLNKIYDEVEMFIDNRDLLDRVIGRLRKIIDIERYNRRITLQSLHPSEFYSLDISYKCVCDLFDDSDLKDMDELTDNDVCRFNEFIEHYSKLFDIDEMGKYNLDNIDGNFVRKGICEKIDEGTERIVTIDDIIEKERLRLIKLLNITTKGNKDPITLHISAEKKEYNYHMTKARYATLKKRKGFEMNEDTPYEHKTVGSYVKFFNSHLRELSKLINEEKRNSKIEIRNFYLEKLRDFQRDYGDVLKKVAVFVTNLDVIQSAAKCAVEFGYCKPELRPGSATSFFDAEAIRHPILERLPFSGEYVTNDIGMTDEKCGLLLYGVNGSGKSSLSKAVGLNIIMAQAGMYAACKSFVLCPYDRLFS